MDAEICISLSINKLKDFLNHEEATTTNQRLKKQVHTAINNLNLLKQFLKDVDDIDDHEASSSSSSSSSSSIGSVNASAWRILKAIYSLEDATDTFLMKNEFQQLTESTKHFFKPIDNPFIKILICCHNIKSCRCMEDGLRDDNDGFTDLMNSCGQQILYTYYLMTISCSRLMNSLYSPIAFTQKMKKFNYEVKHLIQKKGTGNRDRDQWKHNLSNICLSQRQHWGKCSDFCLEDEETHVVGLQRQINHLVVRLVPQRNHNVGQSSEIQASDDQHYCYADQVIAVVGEGGSGKTTLATSVYNSIDVKRHFTTRVWVRISSVFNARDVLVDILKQISQNDLVAVVTLSHDALMRKLTKLLNETKFLIVLDDVDAPQVVLESLGGILSSSYQGKIVIITRNKDGLPPSAAHDCINMCRLNDEESWELFSNKVRIAAGDVIKPVKEQILKVCAGLPVVIVLLGGLLSTKQQSYDEWSRVLSMLANKSTSTSTEDILALIYQHLPSEAKPCFLYMGIFPRRFEIPVRRLIHLWRTEGFVTPPPDQEIIDPEDVAEMCLEELVTRNMVQVRWRLDGTPKTCCMPSVVYDFFSSKAANAGFLHHLFKPSRTFPPQQQKFLVRRLAAYTGIDYIPTSFHHHLQRLRSYVAFDNRVRVTPARVIYMLFDKFISNGSFSLLRVLDLEGVFKPQLTEKVAVKLLLLRYLGLRSTFMNYLPQIVGDLPFLDTLDVKHTNIRDITLAKANKLQHIYLNNNYKQLREDYLESTFPRVSTNLRTLWGLNMNCNNVEFDQDYCSLFDMRKLTKLKLTLLSLSISITDPHHAMDKVAEWINKLTELQSLKLRSIVKSDNDQASIIKLQKMCEHQKLQQVYLLGNLPQSVIDAGFLPPNLKKLTLSMSGLEEDPMAVLGQLPHLNILRLFSDSYRGTSMTCRSKGFPKLRALKLWKLCVQVWTVEEGAMPCLRELEIRSCQNLRPIQGLHNVASLKELTLTNMPMLFDYKSLLQRRDLYIKKVTWNSHPFPESK